MRKVVLLVVVALFLVFALTPFAKAENLSTPKDFKLAIGNAGTNIAELSLKMVSDREKTGRTIGGVCLVAGGGVIALSGIAAGDGATGPLLIIGGTVAGCGALVLMIPTPAEKEYRKVMKFTDAGEREYAAEVSLEYLADKAKRSRIVNGVTSIASGVLNLYLYKNSVDSGNSQLGSSYVYSAIVCFGTGVYQFLVPSYVERINQKVKEEKAANIGLENGSQIPVLVYNF